MDLASGHVAALAKMFKSDSENGLKFYNLSTGLLKKIKKNWQLKFKLTSRFLFSGKGASVLDVIKSFEKVSGIKIPVEYTSRRQGDVPAYYANSELAEKELGWKASKSLDEMIQDVWRWQSENPQGYTDIWI